MEVNFILEKLKSLTGLESFDNYIEDIEKLVDCHNKGKFSMYSRIKLLSKQISLGLDNPYTRIEKLIKYGKDSSSLEVYKLRYGDVEGIKMHKEKLKNTKVTLQKYIEKYGEIDGKMKYIELSKSKSMSLDMCIKRHGQIKGHQVFRDYWDNTGFGTSKKAFEKRHGNEWETYYKKFTENQGKNNTLSGKIIKYGINEGTIKYKELNEKKSKSSNKETVVKKLLNQGMSYQDIQIFVNERWDNVSLKSFISRYGGEDGEEKYREFTKKSRESNPICMEYYDKRNIPEEVAFEIISKLQWERNQKISRYSKESLNYLDKLSDILGKRGHECFYRENELGILLTKKEYDFYKKNRLFFYDFFVPDINLIVEYHGFRFHDDIDYDETLDTKEDVLYYKEYNRDFFKKWIAESRGYDVLVLRSWNIDFDLDKLFNLLKFKEEEKCKFI